MSGTDTHEVVVIDRGNYHCQISAAMVGEVVMCAGFRFVQTGPSECALELLSEADVERLTAPEGSA